RTSPTHLAAQRPQRPGENGKPGQPVHIPVGVDGDGLFPADSLGQALDGLLHMADRKSGAAERRLKKVIDLVCGVVTAAAKHLKKRGVQGRGDHNPWLLVGSGRARGRIKRKSAPFPMSDSTQTFPRWLSTMDFTIANPSPVP